MKKFYMYITSHNKFKMLMIVSVLLSAIVSVMNSYNTAQLRENLQENPLDFTAYGCSFVGDKIYLENSDPQMIINITNKISLLEIEFKKIVPKDLQIRIYYADNINGFTEEQAFTEVVEESSSSLLIDLSNHEYSVLRMDIEEYDLKILPSFKIDSLHVNTQYVVQKSLINFVLVLAMLLISITFVYILDYYLYINRKAEKIKNFNKGIFGFLAIVLLLFLLYISVGGVFEVINNEYEASILIIFIVLFTSIFIIMIFRYLNNKEYKITILLLFVLTLLVRLIPMLFCEVVPDNDFFNYYKMGIAFQQGDYSVINDIVTNYGISTFSGIAVLNGFIAQVFGTSVQSFHIGQAVIASFTAVFIYILGCNISKRVGNMAGIIYAFYPSNILMSQIITNQHWAVCFALLGAILYVRAHRSSGFKIALYACLAAIAFEVSNYAHPSIITTYIATILFTFYVFLYNIKKRKEIKKIFVLITSFIVALLVFQDGSQYALQKVGIMPDNQGLETQDTSLIFYSRLALGLNPEYRGLYSEEFNELGIEKNPEEKKAMYQEMITGYFENPRELIETVLYKPIYMWSAPDSQAYWSLSGFYGVLGEENNADIYSSFREELFTKVKVYIESMGAVDLYYVTALYILATIGLVYGLIKKQNYCCLVYYILILLGWMGVHVLAEVQPRYRYYGMVYIIILASMGVVCIVDLYKTNIYNKSSKHSGKRQ